MTLFTNKEDRRLPLLTQFYQLDMYSSQEEYDRVRNDKTGTVILAYEPDRFIFLFDEGFKDEAYSKSDTWSSSINFDSEEFQNSSPDDDWDGNLQIIHEDICLLMEAVADGSEHTLDEEIPKTYTDDIGDEVAYTAEPTLARLNEYIARYPYSFTPHLAIDEGKLVVHEFENGLGYAFAYEQMIATIFHELITFIKSGKKFRYCPECSSVFQPVKEDRRFCSHRCTARAGQRRRRKEVKEELITI